MNTTKVIQCGRAWVDGGGSAIEWVLADAIDRRQFVAQQTHASTCECQALRIWTSTIPPRTWLRTQISIVRYNPDLLKIVTFNACFLNWTTFGVFFNSLKHKFLSALFVILFAMDCCRPTQAWMDLTWIWPIQARTWLDSNRKFISSRGPKSTAFRWEYFLRAFLEKVEFQITSEFTSKQHSVRF